VKLYIRDVRSNGCNKSRVDERTIVNNKSNIWHIAHLLNILIVASKDYEMLVFPDERDMPHGRAKIGCFIYNLVGAFLGLGLKFQGILFFSRQ